MEIGELGPHPKDAVLLVVLELKFGIGYATDLCQRAVAYLAKEATLNLSLAIGINAQVNKIKVKVIRPNNEMLVNNVIY